MAKNELLQNWNGQQVLSNDHVPELETDCYMLEAQGLPKEAAQQQVYQQYKRKNLIQAAAFHYKAMKAAQGMGAMQEAQKHMLTYGLCLQGMGLDPYGATPPEVLAGSQDPNCQIAYKFQAHPADAFLLQGGPAQQPQPQGGSMTKHEIGHEIYKVLKKATEVLEGADQGAPKDGPSPFEDLEAKAQAAGKPAAQGDAAPTQAPAGGEKKESRKCGNCGADVPFSTTLEGTDNAMGAPGKIPGQPEFCTTLTGQNSEMPAGSIPKVPFSTTLEGTDAAKLGKEEWTPARANAKAKGMETRGFVEPANAKEKAAQKLKSAQAKGYVEKCEKCAAKDNKITKHEILYGIHEIGKELLVKMGAYDLAGAQDMTAPTGAVKDLNPAKPDHNYFVQQQQHPYQSLQGWTPAQTSVGPAAMKPAAGGGVYSIHNIGSRHHVIHSDAQGNITPLGIHGDIKTASGVDLAMGAIAHHELMSRGGQGQGQPGVQPPGQPAAQPQAPQGPGYGHPFGPPVLPDPVTAMFRSEIIDIQKQLAPIYKSIQPLTKHDAKHNIKISRSMGGKRFMDEQGNVYNTLGEAAERLGLQASHIDEVLHGARDQANGHVFKYVDG